MKYFLSIANKLKQSVLPPGWLVFNSCLILYCLHTENSFLPIIYLKNPCKMYKLWFHWYLVKFPGTNDTSFRATYEKIGFWITGWSKTHSIYTRCVVINSSERFSFRPAKNTYPKRKTNNVFVVTKLANKIEI